MRNRHAATRRWRWPVGPGPPARTHEPCAHRRQGAAWSPNTELAKAATSRSVRPSLRMLLRLELQPPQCSPPRTWRTTDVMRAVLHYCGFEACSWPGVLSSGSVDARTRRDAQRRLLHVTRDELASGAAQGGDLGRRALVERESSPGGQPGPSCADWQRRVRSVRARPCGAGADAGRLPYRGAIAGASCRPYSVSHTLPRIPIPAKDAARGRCRGALACASRASVRRAHCTGPASIPVAASVWSVPTMAAFSIFQELRHAEDRVVPWGSGASAIGRDAVGRRSPSRASIVGLLHRRLPPSSSPPTTGRACSLRRKIALSEAAGRRDSGAWPHAAHQLQGSRRHPVGARS